MIQSISYTEKLDKYVKEQDLIPYRLHRNSRYRKNCYYWIDFENKWFKVEEVEYDFSTPIPVLDHIIVVWMDGMQGYLCTDLSTYDFRLEKDKLGIKNLEIVNSKDSFAGGEIEYWMFRHNITFYNKEYKEFWKYVDPRSNCCVDPNKFYYIKADVVNGLYKNVRFILDKSQEKFSKPNKRRELINKTYSIEVTSADIQKERKRRKKKHERD